LYEVAAVISLETEFQTTDINDRTTLTQDDRKLHLANNFKYGPGGIRKDEEPLYLCFIADCRLVGKLHVSGLENCVLLQDGGLRLVVSKRLQHPTLHCVNPIVHMDIRSNQNKQIYNFLDISSYRETAIIQLISTITLLLLQLG
jgi:hypothetical protein